MYLEKEIKELQEISASVAYRQDFVQGAGGNTSVKAADGSMIIKASGFELKDITDVTGFAIVNGKAISDYFNKLGAISDAVAEEKASIEFILKQVVQTNDFPVLRPSMETGFHSLLLKYVIHTHSVYSNIINCNTETEATLEKTFAKESIKPLLIHYCNPGFELSAILSKKIKLYVADYGIFPKVIFLQNHGLIVSSDDKEEAIALHENINDILIKAFVPAADFPEIKLEPFKEGAFKCTSDYLIEKIKKHNPSQQFFDRVLFPDQTVFFNNNFHFGSDQQLHNKININASTAEIIYKTSAKEARTIQETLIAYFYILEKIESNHYQPRFINQSDVDRINNMESEKYRKDLLK